VLISRFLETPLAAPAGAPAPAALPDDFHCWIFFFPAAVSPASVRVLPYVQQPLRPQPAAAEAHRTLKERRCPGKVLLVF
jgi:hypothetical protein